MKHPFTTFSFLAVMASVLAVAVARAEPLTATIPAPAPAEDDYFRLGMTRNPAGHELLVDSYSLRLDGRPWSPGMGEFQYSRCPENEWREELLKLKAGGIDILSTYVFWLHHEEVEGQFDWSGRRDLHRFLQTCKEVGIYALVRVGPWCHGEARNGGLPDWVVQRKDWKTRTTDTNFLAKVTILYGEIAKQLDGMLWKQNGPVLGIQLDNEYHGSADYLIALKGIARLAGIDVPLYSRTGWPALKSAHSLGALLPFFGTYVDGFWDRNLLVMDGDKWTRYTFSKQRIDANIANDIFGKLKVSDSDDTEKYPFLTCELGCGMECSYHRRISVYPNEVESLHLTRLGSGVTLPGFYMYHGGENPEGKLSTLNETQATGYPNDLPIKRYDYWSPLGQYGQLRPHYHGLRRQLMFLRDFGPALTRQPATLPEVRPTNATDLATLRWAARSDGNAGYVFVNNYQRLQPMPAKTGVQFKLKLTNGECTLPSQPVTIPADTCFYWPFNLDLGGATLLHATAQPVCQVDDQGVRTLFFAETPGVPAEFVFDAAKLSVKALSGKAKKKDKRITVSNVKPGRDAAINLKTKSSRIRIVLLTEADSLALWKGEWQGRERVVLSSAGVVFDRNALRLTSEDPAALAVDVLPAPTNVLSGTVKLAAKSDGVFQQFKVVALRADAAAVKTEILQPAGSLRTISLGKKWPIAVAPSEDDFTHAAVWRLKLPADLDLSRDPILRIHYVGDVARVLLNGKLITDNFYNGTTFEMGLRRHAPDIQNGDLQLAILPLQKDAPIYVPTEALPDFGDAKSVVAVRGVELVNRYQATLTVGK